MKEFRAQCCYVDELGRPCFEEAEYTQWYSEDPTDYIEVCEKHRNFYNGIIAEAPIEAWKQQGTR